MRKLSFQGRASINDRIGKYRILADLGGGTFARVYQAQHTYFPNRIVAIKLMRALPLLSQKERDSFIKEAQFLEMLKHPHIVSIIDVDIHDDLPYLVLEYAPNGSLRSRLDKQPLQPLPIEEALAILSQIGEAFQYAHQLTIIHRDLKPENILFNAKGEVLIADFDVATMLATAGIGQGTITGTPPYMAPEQFQGTISKEIDQYALGCIAYELFTGHKPFTVDSNNNNMWGWWYKHTHESPVTPTQLNSQLPIHIEQAILKAMAKERTDRYADVSTFTGALHRPLKTKEQWLVEGNNHYNTKRYEQALAAYQQALRLDPNYAFAYYGKGIALHELKRYEEAAAAYDQALRLDPNYANAYNGKGWTLNDLKRYNEALVACERAIQLDPNHFHAYNNKGNALSGLKRYEEALTAYDQALRLDPNFAIAYNGKGATLDGLKRYEEALTAYDQALRLDPNFAIAYNNKGILLEELKRYQEALAAYEQAVRSDPNYGYAWSNKGDMLKQLGRPKEAEQAYEKAKQLGYKG